MENKIATIPFIPQYNTRTVSGYTELITNGKDGRIISVLPQIIDKKIYATKRPGFESKSTPSSGNVGIGISDDGIGSIFGTSRTVFLGTVNCGTLPINPDSMVQVSISNQTYYMIVTSSQGCFYIPVDATTEVTTFTADTTSGSAVLTNVTGESGVYIGQLLSGTGIPATARVQTIDSATQITMTANATANGTGITVTRTHMAKIIDADFPAQVTGRFVEMDGYLFILDNSAQIWNSDLNSVTSWSALSFISVNMRADTGVTLMRYKNQIAAFGRSSIEFFFNAGNATGSPLGRSENLITDIGAANINAINLGNIISTFRGMIAWSGNSDMTSGGNTTLPDYATPTPGIWLLDGQTYFPKRISTPTIENILYGTGLAPSVDCAFYVTNGGTYLRVKSTSGSNKLGISYHIESGLWFEDGFRSTYHIASDTSVIDTLLTTGKIYRLENVTPVYTDDGTAYTMTIQTPKWDGKTNKRKFLHRISLLENDIQASGTTTLELSTDDYTTWTTLGTFDNTKINPTLYGVGSFEGGAAFRLTHSANTAWRAYALEIEFSEAQFGATIKSA